MKIALVYPPFLNSIQTTLPEFVSQNEGLFQPLGILYIASYLKRHESDCEILAIDAVARKLGYDEIAERLAAFRPDIIGVSCWTFSLVDSLRVAEAAKKRLPDALVCLGGPHATIYPEETAAFADVDFVITGDGEKAFAELVRQLKSGGDLGAVPNLYYKKEGRTVKSRISHTETDLNGLPFPDRTLVPTRDYYSFMDKDELITTMITSRGCPFQCAFCFKQNTGWRYRNIQDIAAEMEECVNMGIRNFFIFDETFTVNKSRMLELCGEIKRRALRITWSCRSRVDTVDEEVLDSMKSAGCNRISFGVESASEEVLKRLNKQIKISRARETFALAKKKSLTTLADFMIGCPGEDRKATSETIQLALELDPDYVQFSLFTLFPATKLYEEAMRQGVVTKDVWRDYAKRPDPSFKPPLWNIYTEEETKGLLTEAYRRFYLRFSYITKKLMRIRTAKELRNHLKAGADLIKTYFTGPK